MTDKKDQKWGWGSENMSVCKLNHVWLFATLWTVAHQAPLSMGFSRQRIPEQVAISSSRGSSWPRDQTHISCFSGIGRKILYHWATKEAWNMSWASPMKEKYHSWLFSVMWWGRTELKNQLCSFEQIFSASEFQPPLSGKQTNNVHLRSL